MRQRVGLARALSVDAQVLLLDEPFSAVDEQTRRKFQEDLLSLVQNEKKTFIFVTHSIEEAVYVSDQIAILLPRPSRVSEIIRPSSFRGKGVNNIRRDPEYLDIVDAIWASLAQLRGVTGGMTLFGYKLPAMSSLILWAVLWEIVGQLQLTFFVPPFSTVVMTLDQADPYACLSQCARDDGLCLLRWRRLRHRHRDSGWNPDGQEPTD